MSKIIKWRDSTVEVQARLVPRWLWTTASIDVLVDGRTILRTGGQMKFTGSHSTQFTHSGATHAAELCWGAGGVSLSIPYQLRLDGVAVSDSQVPVRNWPVGLVGAILMAAVVVMIFRSIHG